MNKIQIALTKIFILTIIILLVLYLTYLIALIEYSLWGMNFNDWFIINILEIFCFITGVMVGLTLKK